MKVAIMQPYFLPYIGYYQLIGSVDLFIVYDNIKYTKKGWINRNRFLQNGADAMFSVPLQSDSDSLDVRDRKLAANFNREKLLNQFKEAYARAPYFAQTFPLIEQIVRHDEYNLFNFVRQSIVRICEHLGITTKIRVSSDIAIDHSLTKQAKVLALCEAVGATCYVNAIGGTALYSPEDFMAHNMELNFIESKVDPYPQFGNPFVPWLSILDVMMFNSPAKLSEVIAHDFELFAGNAERLNLDTHA